ncbi:glycosyltransferase involved in cell wall biosynthesis [Rhizobium rosettiformans]|uniref:Glycosyltransferase family 4 protein n=2 Tax=Rhizobium rosettiformans TaxID=1368430 RepID=A0A4S8PYS8_9HYPH|nr:glycosyltransferase family 4 protein [Rhizobium rosettiformans]MBB5276891.1 glycosyltransferase involved in cell wall biosynthesis [Rhizobium rosettiformans]THV35275.1 glycosyltransferase family 4 protein [Rhizobium rosettiformans W3]
MNIGYFLNTYPVPSATFIRREIEAIEARGQVVFRFAARSFANVLVDDRDILEASRTVYLLQRGKLELLKAFCRVAFRNPRGVGRALIASLKLLRQGKTGIVRHAAYLMQAAALLEEARNAKIEHFHAHYGTNPATVVMLSHLMGGPRYSFTAHGPDEFLNETAANFGLKIQNASFAVAISEYCRTLLADRCLAPRDHGKIVIARCGLNLDEFQASQPTAPNNQTLVCVGRLCPQKGQVHIPAAVAALKGEFPDLRVLLVGDGESRHEIEVEVARYGLDGGNSVVFLGWAANADVRRLISESRALLLPSYHEGLPIVLMEALALARPVITTKITAIPELVDPSCGWLVSPGNHDELVAAMRSALLASPEDLLKMGLAGQQRVALMHDIRDLAEALHRNFEAAVR